MKRTCCTSLSLLIIMLLCIPPVLFARDGLERAFTLDRDGKVYLEGRTGHVEVSSWSKNEVRIVAPKNASIDVNHTKDNIRIIFNRPSQCEIFIPDRAHLRIETTSGNVKAGEIGGFVDIRSASGDIDIAAAQSGVKCKSISGDIHIGKMTGSADLKTTSGKITAESIKGSITAGTVSGKIEIGSFSRTEEIEIESISGKIELRGELSPGGIYKINSNSGNIEMGLPSASNYELRVETFSGSIHCDFELKLSGKIDRKKLQGMVGKGGATLGISSFSGNIRIKKL